MRLWYPLLALICQLLVCCKAQDKASTTVQQEASLLKFFYLNGDDQVVRNTGINLTNRNETLNYSRDCNQLFIKGICTHKLKSKSNNVKKSFRPNDYDDDAEASDDDEASDDEEFSEEAPDHEKLFDDEPGDDEDYVPRHERLGSDDSIDSDMDGDWDWESPRRFYGKHDRERWRPHHQPEYDDDYEPSYPLYYRHHPRLTHYHHRRRHHYQAPAHAYYRTLSHTTPSWLIYPQEYSGRTPILTPALSSYVSNSAVTGWLQPPASYNIAWEPQYYLNQRPAANMFKARLAGAGSWGPYQQNVYNYLHRESNSFFIPPYPLSSNPHLQATTRNRVGFSPANFPPGITASVTPISHHIYQYPRVTYNSRHFAGPFPRSFPRRREFSEAVLNRIRDQNLH